MLSGIVDCHLIMEISRFGLFSLHQSTHNNQAVGQMRPKISYLMGNVNFLSFSYIENNLKTHITQFCGIDIV